MQPSCVGTHQVQLSKDVLETLGRQFCTRTCLLLELMDKSGTSFPPDRPVWLLPSLDLISASIACGKALKLAQSILLTTTTMTTVNKDDMSSGSINKSNNGNSQSDRYGDSPSHNCSPG